MRELNIASIDHIVGVIVLFNTRLEDCETLISLNQSLQFSTATMDIVVYDNSLTAIRPNESIYLFDHVRLHYFHDSSNPGVGKAYNAAAHYAKFKLLNKQWIILLDQDTTFPINTITKYLLNITKYTDQVLFAPMLQTKAGVYSPCRYYLKRGVIWRKITPGLHPIKYKSVLNSGCLVKLDAYFTLEGYDERIKLYFSDFNFIDRYRVKYKDFVVIDLVCSHHLSDLADLTLSSAISRFSRYTIDSHNSSNKPFDTLLLFITVMLRAVKLSIRYRDLIFLKTVYNTYLN